MVDASKIFPKLYQGGRPSPGPGLHRAGFDVLVLCAEEYQPSDLSFPGVRVLRIPFDDAPGPVAGALAAEVKRMGAMVTGQLRRGRRVLVTCQAGLNRSGLVVASTLLQATTMSPPEVVACIRHGRSSMALCNPAFVQAIATGKVGGSRGVARRVEKRAAIR